MFIIRKDYGDRPCASSAGQLGIGDMADQKARLQTLDRGLVALRLLSQAGGGMKVADLAAALGVHRAIAYRIVATLEDHAMACRLPDGRIALGSAVIPLGARAEGNLRLVARPLVEALAREVDAAAFLSIADGEEGVAIVTAAPPDSFLDISYRVGSRHPLTVGAAGIAILAGRPERPDDDGAVRAARRDGYCLTRGQLQKGAVGLASPVRVAGTQAPALDCAVGVVGLEGLDIDLARRAVLSCAGELSARLAG